MGGLRCCVGRRVLRVGGPGRLLGRAGVAAGDGRPPPACAHSPVATLQGREEILRVHINQRGLPLGDDVRVESLAAQVRLPACQRPAAWHCSVCAPGGRGADGGTAALLPVHKHKQPASREPAW